MEEENKKNLENDVVNAITDTINDSNCEDDAKKIIRTIVNMYATIKVMNCMINILKGETQCSK